MKDEINGYIAQAMKNGESDKIKVLRSIKTLFTNFEKEGKELTDADEIKILLKLKSQYEDSINQYASAGRNDLVSDEKNELDVLLEYIPKQPTDEEIELCTKEIINKIVSERNESISMKDMRYILSEVQKIYPTANGKIVSEIVKKY